MLDFKNWLLVEDIGSSVFETFIEDFSLEVAIKNTFRFICESMDSEDEGPAELDDPFSGSEDAEPVKTYDSEDSEEDTEEEQPNRQRRKRQVLAEPSIDKSILGKKLLNAILWMRWKAMASRQRDINKLIEIREIYKKQNPEKAAEIEARINISSKTSVKESLRGTTNSYVDMSEVEALLEKLGYLDTQQLLRNKRLTQEEKDDIILEVLFRASRETGNEVPLDVRRMGEEKISRKAQAASKMFMKILMQVFQSNYQSISNSKKNQSKVKDAKKTGYRLFGNDLDVATSFIDRMNDLMTTRPMANMQFGASGNIVSFSKPKEWFSPKSYKELGGPDLGSGGYSLEMGDSEFSKEFAKRIIGFFGSYLGQETRKTKREGRSTPSAGAPDTQVWGGNRSRKASVINNDLKAAKELRSEGKSVEPVLRFYLTYLSMHSKGQEGLIKTSNQKDRYRKDIMDQIISLVTRQPDLYSTDPSKIEDTLSNYRYYVLLNSPEKTSTFLGDLNNDNQEGSEDTYFDPEEADRVLRADSGVRSPSDPSSIAANTENTAGLLGMLKKIMEDLSEYNPKAAFALCVKWGLGCTPSVETKPTGLDIQSVRINSVAEFSRLAIAMTTTGKVAGGQRTDCVKQIQAIGIKKPEDVANVMNRMIPNLNARPETIRTHLTVAHSFVCNGMRKALEDIQNSLNQDQDLD